jgi:hypothetical protein
MARGTKTGGRRKGTPNKMTASVKSALEEAFEQLGGVEVLANWAEENPGDFFKLWVKILPRDFSVENRVTLEDLVCGTNLKEGNPRLK